MPIRPGIMTGNMEAALRKTRKQLNDALIDGYGQAIENLQATLEATKGAAEKPSLTGTLKENAGKVKEQPTKPAPSKNEQAR